MVVPPQPVASLEQAHAVMAYRNFECTLCKETGKDNANTHEVEECWANPHSQRYSKSAYEARLLDCYKKKIAVPALMKVYEHKAENFPILQQPNQAY